MPPLPAASPCSSCLRPTCLAALPPCAGEEMTILFDMQLEECLQPKYRGLQVGGAGWHATRRSCAASVLRAVHSRRPPADACAATAGVVDTAVE